MKAFLSGVFALVGLLSPVHGHGAVIVVTNTADSGDGSLRQAILFANTNAGLDTIEFNIPGAGVRTIALLSTLPALTDPVLIDAWAQPGFDGKPLVELNGTGAGVNSGLRLLGGNSTVRGLVLNRFGVDGIRIESLGSNIIQGNFIGTDASGMLARPNAGQGIFVTGSGGNLIGGANPGDANLISGNAGAGVYLFDRGENVVQGNLIGTALPGTAYLGNGYGGTNNGISVYDSAGNLVGGTNSGARNILSGNRGSGVYLYGLKATGNRVQGNYIGTDITGSLAISNLADGVSIAAARGNLVGGTNAGEGNVLSGNGKAGVGLLGSGVENNIIQGNLIGTSASGLLALGNTLAGVSISGARSNVVGGDLPGAGNVISGNKQDGILITNSAANIVQGNLVGLDVSGARALGNRFNGLTILNALSNSVGGTTSAARNTVSGNAYHGIHLAAGAKGNSIRGNYVGLAAGGASAVPNNSSGVRVESAGNFIGGVESGAGNVLSGNATNGLFFVGSEASNNIVQGNLMGTDPSGTLALANGVSGLGSSDAPGNVIGGTAPGSGNLISGNANSGMYLFGRGADGNQVQGNKIGTDVSGTKALGNKWEGIYLDRSRSNTIGGTSLGAANVVSANNGRGIWLTDSSWNVIAGNLVGTSVDGAGDLGNAWHAVECGPGATNNLIGGGEVRAGNRIAYSHGAFAGVRIRAGGLNNAILGNAIFSNGALGIDLGDAGVLANDNCDLDQGANQQQNAPVLTQAVAGARVGIRGTLNSTASSSFLVQFFASSSPDPSGFGEGEIHLGDILVATGPDCTGSFTASVAAAVPAGFFITATATDSAGNTSEFSNTIAAGEAPSLSATLAPDGQMKLSWPATATGFVLLRAASLAPPIPWAVVSGNPAVENGRYVVTVPLAPGNEFFALEFE